MLGGGEGATAGRGWPGGLGILASPHRPSPPPTREAQGCILAASEPGTLSQPGLKVLQSPRPLRGNEGEIAPTPSSPHLAASCQGKAAASTPGSLRISESLSPVPALITQQHKGAARPSQS